MDSENKEDNNERLEALKCLFEYLRDQHGTQYDALKQVDSKIKLQLTLSAVLLGFIYFALPVVNDMGQNKTWPLLAVAVFGPALLLVVSLARMFWLVINKLDVDVFLPGMDPDLFRAGAKSKSLERTDLYENLIVNYIEAIAANTKMIDERVPAGKQLQWWNKVAVIVMIVALLGLVATNTVASYAKGDVTKKRPTSAVARNRQIKKTIVDRHYVCSQEQKPTTETFKVTIERADKRREKQ